MQARPEAQASGTVWWAPPSAGNETTGVSRPDFPAEQSNLSCSGERRDSNADALAISLGADGAGGTGFDGPEICMCVGG